MNKSVKIDIENVNELKKLLATTKDQLGQFEDTISKLDGFELKIASQVDEEHIHSNEAKVSEARPMDQKDMLLELVGHILTGEYELLGVSRSNRGGLQEYDFVITKASSKGDQASKNPMTKEEFDRL